MTAREYKVLARLIGRCIPFPMDNQFTQSLIAVLEADNPRFNTRKFVAAIERSVVEANSIKKDSKA